MTFSRSLNLHFGEPEPLTFELVQRAIEDGVREDDFLDWKEDIPEADEFAKDVAAFANTRGGVIICGVVEDRDTSQASSSKLVSTTDGESRRLRSLLATRVSPIISGLAVEPLPDPSDATQGYMAISIPESALAPHFVGGKKSMGVPQRDGTGSRWLNEWEIEGAYRDRFHRLGSDNEWLSKRIDYFEDQLDLTGGSWLVGVSRIAQPLVLGTPRPDVNAVTDLLGSASRLSEQIYPDGVYWSVLRMLDDHVQPTIGLRRWVFNVRPDNDPGARTIAGRIDLHDDGSVSLASHTLRFEGMEATGQKEKYPLYDSMIKSVCADLLALVSTTAAAIGSQALIRVDVLRPDPDLPLAYHEKRRMHSDEYSQAVGSVDVRRFIPTDISVDPVRVSDNMEELQAMHAQMVADISNQFGVFTR